MTPTEYLFAALNQIWLALGPALLVTIAWIFWRYAVADLKHCWRDNAPDEKSPTGGNQQGADAQAS